MTNTPRCSTCERPATARVAGADPSKGNLVCDACKPMWALATFEPLDGAR